MGNKTTSFVDQLLRYVRDRCECKFSSAHIQQPRFVCFDRSPQHITFRASLAAHQDLSTVQLVSFLEDWKATHRTVVIQEETLFVTGEECPVVVLAFDDQECSSHTPKAKTSHTPLLIGGTIAAAICTAIIFAIIVVCLLLHKRCKRYSETRVIRWAGAS